MDTQQRRTSLFSRPPSSRTAARRGLAVAVAAGLAAALALPLWAKHPENAGPADPPIKFVVPTPAWLTPAEQLATFKIAPGYRIEPVVVEPMVEDPVSVTLDADGRMWVVEMVGYMRDVDGTGEQDPVGRIKVLEDADGDGTFEKATVFADKLVMPRAVVPVRGGALIGEPPELSFWATGPDGKGTKQTVIATDFGRKGGQPEHMANTLMVGLDNWVYAANHTSRYRFRQGKWVAEASRSRGQWGLGQDDWGRLFFSYNSDLARADVVPSQYLNRNPYYPANVGQNSALVPDHFVWPSHPTPGVNRGYQPKELRQDGTLQRGTAVCGGTIYRGDLLPKEAVGDYFVAEPSANLVKRMKLVEKGGMIEAVDAYDGVEFLTSTDERFRPVSLNTGPDGALYVVDMYRGVLQHTGFLTNYLIKNIKARKLETPLHGGRIWRIVPDKSAAAPKLVKLPTDPKSLVPFLAHANGAVRDLAQQRLVELNKDASVPGLEKMAGGGPTPQSRVHALWALEGMGKLEPSVAFEALADADPHVRAAAIRLAEPQLVPALREQGLPEVLKLAGDKSPEVQFQLALTLSNVADPRADEAVAVLLTTTSADLDLMRDAVLSGLRGRELEFAERLLKNLGWAVASPDKVETLSCLSRAVLAERRTSRVKRLLELAAAETDGSWRQSALLSGSQPRVAAKRAFTAQRPPSFKEEPLPASETVKVDAADDTTDPTPAPATKPATPATKPTSAGGGKSVAAATKPAASTKPAVAAKPSAPAGPPVKLIYLDAKPEAIVVLLASKDQGVRELAEKLDRRLAWPDKPGVPPPPKVVPLTVAQQKQFERGKEVFGQTCAACHQPTGLGQDGLAPPLLDSEWALGPDKRIIRIALHGMTGPVTVAGAAYSMEMPPLGGALPDEDLAAVITYVRREWEHTSSPVSVEAVKKAREETKARSDPWTAKELMDVK